MANVFSLLEKNMEDTWFIIWDEQERLASEKDYTFDWAALHARNHCTPMRWPRIFMLLCKNQHYDGRFWWPDPLRQPSNGLWLDGLPLSSHVLEKCSHVLFSIPKRALVDPSSTPSSEQYE